MCMSSAAVAVAVVGVPIMPHDESLAGRDADDDADGPSMLKSVSLRLFATCFVRLNSGALGPGSYPRMLLPLGVLVCCRCTGRARFSELELAFRSCAGWCPNSVWLAGGLMGSCWRYGASGGDRGLASELKL